MRSPRGFAASIVLILGVLSAAAAAVTFDRGADAIIHLTLGASFILFAFAVFDFSSLGRARITAGAAIGTLGAVFLLQAASDLTDSTLLDYLAYDLLGQRFEKLLGFAFLAWCLALLLVESRGKTKLLGIITMAAVVCVEAYGHGAAYLGGAAPGALKLLYVPLFIWLLLESRKPREPRRDRTAQA